MTSLTVIVPVFNEQHLVAESLARLEWLAADEHLSRLQIVVVDDRSTDSTPDVLRRFQRERGLMPSSGDETRAATSAKIEWVFVRQARNTGKGGAIKAGLAHADCEITVVHDADLEYHPKDLSHIVRVFEEEDADAVFGSRFAGSPVRRVLLFRHELGNRVLTLLTNLVTDLNLTDMETCYKAVRTDLLRSIPLVSDDFRLEPELTIKLARRGARLFEVPIRYSGRTYREGKKINWRDGLKALGAIARFAASDDLYVSDQSGGETLARLGRAPRFNRWMADVVRPYCGTRVLEIGSGTGNITCELIPREQYVATDVNPSYLRSLRALEPDRPYLRAAFCDVRDAASFPAADGAYDTVICLNVVEHIEDDLAAVKNIRNVLVPGGRAIILVPQGKALFGSLDEVLGHCRRYDEPTLRDLAARAGFRVIDILPFNRIGTAAWFLNGKILRRRHFGLVQVHALNLLTPLFRHLESRVPLPPLSLVAVLEACAAKTPLGREGADAAKKRLGTDEACSAAATVVAGAARV